MAKKNYYDETTFSLCMHRHKNIIKDLSRYVPELANHSPLGLNFTEDTAFV